MEIPERWDSLQRDMSWRSAAPFHVHWHRARCNSPRAVQEANFVASVGFETNIQNALPDPSRLDMDAYEVWRQVKKHPIPPLLTRIDHILGKSMPTTAELLTSHKTIRVKLLN